MKKIILALLLFFILYVPGYTQEPPIFLPLIFKGPEMPTITEKWKVISPVESTNYVLNPSGETTSNYSALGAATVTRSSTYQKYGVYSYRVQTGTNGSGVSFTLLTLPNENCFATARIRGRLPVNFRFIIGTGLKTPQLIEKIDTQWSLYGVMFAASECSGRTELRMIQQGNGIGDFYVDGVQVENLEYWTSYIDGDQEGCYWNGVQHGSSSTRSGKSMAGGQVKDLYKDYGFLVEKVIGAGAATREATIDEYALLPGGELNEIKIHPREWSLIGKFIADSDDELYQNRQDLIELLRKNPQKQPIKLLFYHPRGIRENKAFYIGGLEGDQSVFYDSWITEDDDKWLELNKYIEKAAIQLRSPDPYFYGQGEKSQALDANDTATFRLVGGRLKSTGQWDDLGPPNAAGTYVTALALAEDETYLYIGGEFQNFDNIANADRIVRYNKATGVYSAMGTGANNDVNALAVGPDGSVYAGGLFTTINGSAIARLARWDGSTWSQVGPGQPGGEVKDMVFDLSGNLHIVGAFTDVGGVAASRWAYFDGLVWTQGASLDNTAYCATLGLDGYVYVGGDFTEGIMSNSPGDKPDTLNDIVHALAVDAAGKIYAGGRFTSPITRAGVWNGSAWTQLGTAADNTVFALVIAPDGVLYAGGDFTTIGGITVNQLARWNGFAWNQLDLEITAATVWRILTSKYSDPVIPQKYDIFFGSSTSGTATFAGKATSTNEGSIDVFPKFVFKRTGGSAIAIQTIRNETTGKELLFNYTLLDGEQLTIDLTPTKKSITSSFFGDRLDALLPNSNFGDFVLEIGSNNITSFAADNFSLYPTSLDAFVIWKETYGSYE